MHILHLTILWAHLLAMIGALGGLFVAIYAFSITSEQASDRSAKSLTTVNTCLMIGFLAGLALTYLRVTTVLQAGLSMSTTFNHLILTKLLLLLAAGAGVGIGTKKIKNNAEASARVCFILAMVALTLASFLGVMLRAY